MLLIIVPLVAQPLPQHAPLVLLTLTGSLLSVLPAVMVNTPLLEQLPQPPQLPASLVMIATVLNVKELEPSNALSVPPTTTWMSALVLPAQLENGQLLVSQLVLVLVTTPIAKAVLMLAPPPVLPATPDTSWTQQPTLVLSVLILNVILVLAVLKDNAHFARILRLTPLPMVFARPTLSLSLSRKMEELLPPLYSVVLLPCLNPWVERVTSLPKWLTFLVLMLLKLKSSVSLKVQSSFCSRFTPFLPIPQSMLEAFRPFSMLPSLLVL